MGGERSAAYDHGHCMVVCWSARDVAVKEKRWNAEEESFPSSGYNAYGVGHECTSSGSRVEHTCPHRLWLHAYGRRGGQDSGDFVCPSGPKHNIRYAGGGD